MALEALKKFAEELKSIREEKGFTLQQIANHTKIDIKFLQQIEEGKFDILPELYIRAFIKEYAQTIDTDVNEIIRKYDIAKSKISDVKSSSDEKLESQQKISNTAAKSISESKKEFDAEEYFSPPLVYPEEENKTIPYKRYIFFAGAVIAVLVLVYFLFIHGNSPDIIEEKPYEDVVTDRYRIDTTAANTETRAVSDSLNLSITPTNLVWIKVLCDKKEVYRKMTPANQSLNFKAKKEFYVVVGNAGHVKMKFNNKPVVPAGNIGEIRNYYISSDTIRSYLIPIPKKDEKKSTTEN